MYFDKVITDKRLRECNYGDYNGHSSSVVEPMQEINIHINFPMEKVMKR